MAQIINKNTNPSEAITPNAGETLMGVDESGRYYAKKSDNSVYYFGADTVFIDANKGVGLNANTPSGDFTGDIYVCSDTLVLKTYDAIADDWVESSISISSIINDTLNNRIYVFDGIRLKAIVSNIIANKGVGLEDNIPTTSLVEGDVYVSSDTFKKFSVIDGVYDSGVDLEHSQIVIDAIYQDAAKAYIYDGTQFISVGGDSGSSGFQNTLYVSKNGDDSTGERNTLKPFLTLEAARDAAQSGDTIKVKSGTYTKTDTITVTGLSKDGVAWDLEYGVVINDATTTATFNNLSTFAKSSDILGFGVLNKTGGYGAAIANSFNASGSIIELKELNTSGTSRYGILLSGGASANCSIKLPFATNTSNYQILSIEIQGKTRVDMVSWESVGSCINTTSSSGTILVNGNLLKSTTTTTIAGSGSTALYTINVNRIEGITYGIKLGAISHRATINCEFITGVHMVNGTLTLNGYANYIYQQGGTVHQATCAYLNMTGGTFNGVITAIFYQSSAYYTRIDQSGGVANIHIGNGSANGETTLWNITGGVTNIYSMYCTGAVTVRERKIDGGEVNILGDFVLGNTNMNAIGTEKAGLIYLKSGSLRIANRMKNGMLASTYEQYLCVVYWEGGDLICDRATLISNGGTPIRSVTPNQELIVLAGGLTTNQEIDNINGVQKIVKCTVESVAETTVRIDTGSGQEIFTESDTTTYNTIALMAARMVELVNASGTLEASASQDSSGVDEYFYVESTENYDFTITDVNLSLNTEQLNSHPYSEIAGGTILESEYAK